MESVFVNWEALDSLVIEFAKSEHLIEDSSSPSSPPSSPSSTSTTTTTTTTSYSSISSSSYRSRLIIRRIRRCLETGDVDSALDLLRTHAPSVLDDHRLLFRLQKQKFIELLRRGTKHDRHLAIDCLRKALAPCALDAYPEAYEEFKHVLLALIFDKDDQASPVASENELCRVKPDVAVIDELVHEYCIYRGIVDGDLASSSGIKAPGGPLIMCQADNNSSNDCPSISMDFQMSKPSDGEVSISNAEKDDCQQVDAEAMSTERTNVELRSTCEVISNYESCSTSEVNNSATCRKYSRSRGQETGERRRRKRWRGRIEMEESNHDVSFNEDHTKSTLEEEKVLDKRDDNRFEFVLEMKDLASKGKATEVVEEVNSKDPIFFVQNPVLLFQLKQVEFLKLVNSGNHSKALRIASSCLGPLVAKNPSLLKPLKETLVALLRPDEDALVKAVPFPILASSLQVAMGRRLGIEEPQLMKLMRAALHTHGEWFRLQMCKDRFEGLLKIDSLKEIITPSVTDDASKMNTEACTPGSSQVTISSSITMADDDNSPMQVSSGDVICDENAILKVMEFLALPRADAIHLLAQYNGNAETVIQEIFT